MTSIEGTLSAPRRRRWAWRIALGAVAGTSLSCTQSAVAPSGNVTVATPAIIAPANGSQIANLKQPITLTVNNAFVAGGQAASLYEFQVASDPAFASTTQSPTATPGANGQTSVVLATLLPGQTYYWRVRANAGSTVGTYSSSSTFVIGAALGIGTPTIVSPASGSTPSGWPTFIVNDAVRTGPLAQVSYRFDVSSSSSFSPIILTATVAETAGQTSFTPSISTPFTPGTQLFWRATAIDGPDGITSAPTTTQSFTPQPLTPQAILAAQIGQPLWPGAQPAGSNGHAVLGDGCDGSPNWGVATCFSPISQGVFQAPTIEALRYFDLFDRGYDPPSAISWMIANGYPTAAQWYPPPDKAVLGLGLFYLAARNKFLGDGAIWDIVIGLG